MLKCEVTYCQDTCRFCCAHESESARIPFWVATLPAPGIGAHCTDAHDRGFLQGSCGNGARQLPGEAGLAEKSSFP